MKLAELHQSLVGEWAGRNHLFLDWLPEPEHVSDSTLSVTRVAGGKFLSLAYTWSHEGQAQDGVLLVGNDNGIEEASAAWVDAWHMSTQVMYLSGRIEANGVVTVLGSYPAPPGPDWGWRIRIHSAAADMLTITMHNLSPDNQEDLAMQADFRRVTSAAWCFG